MPKELVPLLEPGILYSKCPWRFHPDPPLLEKLFESAPVVELPAHIDHAFGRESFVYWIDQGILATCAPRTRGPRMTALFVPRTILGGPKALLHKRPLELTIRTLSPVRLRRRDALQFRRFLADHPGIESSNTCAHWHGITKRSSTDCSSTVSIPFLCVWQDCFSRFWPLAGKRALPVCFRLSRQ